MNETVKSELIRIVLAALLGGAVAFLVKLVEGLTALPTDIFTDPAVGSTTAATYVRLVTTIR